MYDIKQRQIQNAIKHHKERPNLIELLQKSGLELSEQEKENILIFGNIRGPYAYTDNKQKTIYEGWQYEGWQT